MYMYILIFFLNISTISLKPGRGKIMIIVEKDTLDYEAAKVSGK